MSSTPIFDDVPLNDIEEDERKLKRSLSATGSVGSTGGPKSRRRGCSAHENAANTAAKGMSSIATSMTAPQATRFDQCMEVLKEMESNEEITMRDLFRVSQFLLSNSGESDVNYAALFFGLPTQYRVDWLKEKNLLDSEQIES